MLGCTKAKLPQIRDSWVRRYSRDGQRSTGAAGLSVNSTQREAVRESSPAGIPEPMALGSRGPREQSRVPVPQAQPQGALQLPAWRPVPLAPFPCAHLFLRPWLAKFMSSAGQEGCWAQPKPRGSLFPHIPLTLACPWPSVAAKLPTVVRSPFVLLRHYLHVCLQIDEVVNGKLERDQKPSTGPKICQPNTHLERSHLVCVALHGALSGATAVPWPKSCPLCS